ncbi:MAG: hypothetical protein ACREH8_02605 [Opitutaceae bacterium]
MSAGQISGDEPLGGPGAAGSPAARPRLQAQQRRQLWLITVGAVVIFFGLRLLPTGTNLSHMDFRVDPKAGNVIEFCDPLNPQFVPVVAARSPVTMSIVTGEPATAGREVRAVVTLKTGSGKPVAPEDLVVMHTRLLHLLIIDPSLADYQHVHPEPARTAGEWAFSFSPRSAGAYRVFADFTPAATGRGLYASADLNVAGGVSDARTRGNSTVVERGGVVFTLSTAQPVRAGQPIDLRFAMSRPAGGEVALEPVMGAFAHLVAFDEARSGFAHLHPAETDLLKQPDTTNPALNFKLTIPRAGRYVVWAQVNIGGNETFVPFELSVVE